MFDILTSQNRYAVLYRIDAAKRADTRARGVEQYVAMLARGETIYPQKRTRAGLASAQHSGASGDRAGKGTTTKDYTLAHRPIGHRPTIVIWR